LTRILSKSVLICGNFLKEFLIHYRRCLLLTKGLSLFMFPGNWAVCKLPLEILCCNDQLPDHAVGPFVLGSRDQIQLFSYLQLPLPES